MITPALAGAIAGLALVLFAAAAGLAGSWRRQPPGGDGVPLTPLEPVPDRLPASLAVLAWHLRVAGELYRAVLLVALGLTPLGARFVHLIAPDATPWRVAAAMEIIVVAAWGPPRLLTTRWLHRPAGPARRWSVHARPDDCGWWSRICLSS